MCGCGRLARTICTSACGVARRRVAVATYRPTVVGAHVFVVRYPGSDLLAESEETLVVTVDGPLPAYVVAPRGLDTVAAIAPLLVAVLVLGIWATFAYVLFQVVRIRRAAAGSAGPGVDAPGLPMKSKEGSI